FGLIRIVEVREMLPVSSTAADILALVEQFVDNLATRDYGVAHSLLRQSQHYAYWTPALIEEVISSYGPPTGESDVERSQVTARSSAREAGYSPCREVTFYEEPSTLRDASIGDVHYDLPINGVWSDLTAIFGIHRDEAGVTLELEDIHVL